MGLKGLNVYIITLLQCHYILTIGIPFDCVHLPTGHWRDPNFCDVFHACVHGYHRKTYACPIVGERTYFDEVTQQCQFVRFNPHACVADYKR